MTFYEQFLLILSIAVVVGLVLWHFDHSKSETDGPRFDLDGSQRRYHARIKELEGKR